MPPAKPRLTLTCQYCSGTFQLLACQTKNGRGRFCSRECGNAAKRTGAMLTCVECGETFYRFPAEQARGGKRRQFCSRPCYFAWRKAHRSPSTYERNGPDHVHRLVAEAVLERSLAPGETVHHIDEDRMNNAVSNLAVFPSQADHARCHSGRMSDEELDRYRLSRLAGHDLCAASRP